MATAKDKHRAYGIGIQKRLLDIDMSQKELAELVGIDPKRMSDLVRGSRALYQYRDRIEEILTLAEKAKAS
jgi:plasmid maintenance system antidote protein VapI